MSRSNQFNDDLADLLYQHKGKAKPRFRQLRRMQRKTGGGLKLVDTVPPPEGGNGVLIA